MANEIDFPIFNGFEAFLEERRLLIELGENTKKLQVSFEEIKQNNELVLKCLQTLCKGLLNKEII